MKRLFALFLTLLMMVTSLPALADTPTPISKIPYDQLPENRDGIYHYLLLCMDAWDGNLKDNNDGIVLMTFDTRAGRIMLTSLLRDSLVQRPDGKIGRINYIVKNHGPEALCEIISTHLGIKVDKYVVFNFQQIANIIDYMGGVEIEVNASEASYLRRYPLSAHQTTPSMNRAGTYLFTGRAAVIYMRIRKGNGGDHGERGALTAEHGDDALLLALLLLFGHLEDDGGVLLKSADMAKHILAGLVAVPGVLLHGDGDYLLESLRDIGV